jgi:hypothetical protein
MSHIDSFKHEIVGLFGYLPVYHPLENLEGDFFCTKKQLMLGGGSGEHPALVIDSPLFAVAYFLNQELSSLKDKKIKAKHYPLKKKIDQWSAIIEPFLDREPKDIIKYYDWDAQRHENFHQMCRSSALPNQLQDENFEEWFVLGIGEFVFFSMPDLASEIMNKLCEPYKYFSHIYYNNIMVIPPNFPVYANGGNAFCFSRKNKYS